MLLCCCQAQDLTQGSQPVPPLLATIQLGSHRTQCSLTAAGTPYSLAAASTPYSLAAAGAQYRMAAGTHKRTLYRQLQAQAAVDAQHFQGGRRHQRLAQLVPGGVIL